MNRIFRSAIRCRKLSTNAPSNDTSLFSNVDNIINMMQALKLPKFALGGFSGDNNLAFLNKNELVLRPMEQASLYNAIRGHNLGTLANSSGNDLKETTIMGEVVLRGTTQVIQLRRSERKMNRFYNS